MHVLPLDEVRIVALDDIGPGKMYSFVFRVFPARGHGMFIDIFSDLHLKIV